MHIYQSVGRDEFAFLVTAELNAVYRGKLVVIHETINGRNAHTCCILLYRTKISALENRMLLKGLVWDLVLRRH